MDYPKPVEGYYTIYTKLRCKHCDNLNVLLREKNIQFIDIFCDDYIKENREAFLEFIKELVGKEYTTFPMVFDENKEFIGGFSETNKLLNKTLEFDMDF